MPFVKIYDSILRSSVWLEDPSTRIVWITLLTLADQNGHVEASVPGLAHTANVPLKNCRAALKILEAPDPESKDPSHDGRRIESADGGWQVLNYQKYREMPTPSAIRMRRFRAKQSASLGDNVASRSAEADREVEGEAEEEHSFYQSRANPLLKGRRPKLESEVLAMVRELSELEGKDPLEVLAEASDFEGANRTKINPAAMTDDRLANTWRDLRHNLEIARKKHGKAKEGAGS